MKIKLIYADITKTHFDEDIALELIKKKDYSAWEIIHEFETPDERISPENPLEKFMEGLFFETNEGDMLSSKESQSIIKNSKGRHTSMSVSDLVQIDNRFMMCMDSGFKEVILEDPKFKNVFDDMSYKPKWVYPRSDK